MTQSVLEKPELSFSDFTLPCNAHLSWDVIRDFRLDAALSNLVLWKVSLAKAGSGMR